MSIVVNDGPGGPIDPSALMVAKAATPGLVGALKVALADAFTLYTRAHGFHWNVKGGAFGTFGQWHALFEAIYSDTYESIDPMAENLLKLGSDAPFRLDEFVALRTIKDAAIIDDPLAMAADLLAANEQMIATLVRTFAEANAANEQGIANFIAERIDAHQKWSWQLRASLERG